MNNFTSAETQADGQSIAKTICRICPAFCGIEVTLDGGDITKIGPDKNHPNNWRDFCSKAYNSNRARTDPRRITRPMKRVGDRYIETSYEDAIAEIASQLIAIKDKHGPNAIATYLGNPGMTSTASSAFMGGLMAGIGSDNNFLVGSIDQNNHLLVADRMYGSEFAVLNPDIDVADCILLFGANPAVSCMGWVEQSPNGWKRVLARTKQGADLIIVDPRATPSTQKATVHVMVEPGQDWALMLGMLKIIFENGWECQADCMDANRVDVIRETAEKASLKDLSARSRVTEDQIRDITRRFATAKNAFCIARTGVSQNQNGTLGEWLSQVLNLVTGRIDRPGGKFYQPGLMENSMQAYNRMTPRPERRSRIGNFETIGGCYPLAILPDEILTPGEDQIRALILNAGNPVNSGPDGARLDSAMQELELLISVDLFQRESHRHADWLIPASHFLEREDYYSALNTLGEKSHVQLAHAAVNLPEGVKHDWEFFLDLALAMDVPFMGRPQMNEMVKASREKAVQSGDPRLAFNPRSLWGPLTDRSGQVKWEDVLKEPQGFIFREKEYGLFRPLLQTPDGKIQAAPQEFVDVLKKRLAETAAQGDEKFPLRMVNQRRASMMNSWLVESNHHRKEYGAFVDINPADAADRNIRDGETVRVWSETNEIELTACVTEDVPPGIISIDHGWGSRMFDPKSEREPEIHGVNRNQLVSPHIVDELTGVPNLNGTRVNILACE